MPVLFPPAPFPPFRRAFPPFRRAFEPPAPFPPFRRAFPPFVRRVVGIVAQNIRPNWFL
jgi:hypothetical protein